MANNTWKGGTANWDSANWTTGAAPGVTDTAVIGSGTVNVTNFNDQALGLSLTGGVLNVTGELSIGTSTVGSARGTISNTGGTVQIGRYGSVLTGMYLTAASGTVTLAGEGATYQWAGSNSTQNIVFQQNNLNATFQFLTNFGGTVSGFGAGQFITYSTTNMITKVTIGNDIVSFFDSAGEHDVRFTGNYNSSNLTVTGTTITTTVACYCTGSLILTSRGEVPVESLSAGDTVVTAGGACRTVRWIGRRSYAGRFLLANPGAQPVRLRAGSLGNGLPRRDLLVSPEHAMFLDGVLVAARNLVNGTTVMREHGLGRVDYHHVELDSHDLLLAEGAPSESFVDDDSRGMFPNAPEWERLHPGRARVPAVFCAPRVEGGPALEAIRRRLDGATRQVFRDAA